MTVAETEKYFKSLTAKEAFHFSLLTAIAMKLGKPTEGAYEYAHTIMEEEKNGK